MTLVAVYNAIYDGSRLDDPAHAGREAFFVTRKERGVVVKKLDLELVSVTEAARLLGTSRGAIHHHRLTGRLPAIRATDRYLIARADVERLKADRDRREAAQR